MNNKICAVVVTYNRLILLQECVRSLLNQTRQLDQIIVVNNGSTDETFNWLKNQSGLTVINQLNKGSSGGQYAGVKAAFEAGHDWIWCMDDDTIPDRNALMFFEKAPYFKDQSAGFLASRIIYDDGSDQPLPFDVVDRDSWFGKVLDTHCIQTEMATFVSVIFNRKAIEKVGLPCPDFFIIWDDSEFTKRISGWGKSWHVLDSIAVHKTPDRGANGNSTSGIKFNYHQRNRIYFIKLQKYSIAKKAWNIFKLFVLDLIMLTMFKIKPIHFFWTIKGIIYSPKIEKV